MYYIDLYMLILQPSVKGMRPACFSIHFHFKSIDSTCLCNNVDKLHGFEYVCIIL